MNTARFTTQAAALVAANDRRARRRRVLVALRRAARLDRSARSQVVPEQRGVSVARGRTGS